MANGKLRDYYWRLVTFLAECLEYLDSEHSAFQFPADDEVINTGVLTATLVFRDGSQLYVRASLDERAEVREYDYAYTYHDRRGKRIFQYDDAPHHPKIPMHPHHLHRGGSRKRKKERVYAIDVPQVDFITIVEKVIGRMEPRPRNQ